MKNNMILILVCAAALVSCSDWTDYESIDYSPQTPQEQDPAAYENRLAAVREFKQTAHNISIATIKGTSQTPSFRSQHPTDVPDSVDFICVKEFDGLHPVIASEIIEVRERKGTRTVAFIDCSTISAEWKLMEDARADEGGEAYTEEERLAFFKAEAEEQLSEADKYGFDGIMVSVDDTEQASNAGFFEAVDEWRVSRPDALVFLRGAVGDVVDSDLVGSCDYHVIPAGEESIPGQLVMVVMRELRSGMPKDRVIIEVTVPSEEESEQIGATPQVASGWVADYKADKNRLFTPQGVCLANAHDDYFHDGMMYGSLRQAIQIMNVVSEE